MRGQTSGSGRPLDRLRSLDWLSDRPHGGLQLLGGPSKPGPAKDPRCTNLVSGPSRPDPVSSTSIEAGLLIFGLTTVKDPGWAKAKESFVAPGGPNPGISIFRVKDGLRKQIEEEHHSEERSKTDLALIEEALRYGNAFNGMLASRFSFSPFFFSDQTPMGEYYDFSGAEDETITRWELMEVNNGSNKESREELCLVQTMPQEVKGWEEVSWKESNLVRFSKFLGFPTEGLEKDILDFLVKIRKRRERVHSKTLLEKSKFERELKRLECSITYEGGEVEMWYARKRVSNYGSPIKLRLLSWNMRGANDSFKRKVIKALIRSQRVDLFCLQETKIQAMSEGVVRSLCTGRFLDWGTLDAYGSAGGILIYWDKRTLDVLEMEVGHFSTSCRLRNVEDGLVWIFTGVYGPFSREVRDCLWEELGAIRGIWDDPWCLGGDFQCHPLPKGKE
ncbi:hypothetical protein CK203_007106 [Vitis vinifera]|uniref:Endonuclease/exonuclease/phosphatase domain-containing protein n=1 Tax=Vitis vinifera TaxID=29760 RepID=A0A438KCU7_VITVI|nr:hypothetical protein CK203_007106 [Vitis vinifera]